MTDRIRLAAQAVLNEWSVEGDVPRGLWDALRRALAEPAPVEAHGERFHVAVCPRCERGDHSAHGDPSRPPPNGCMWCGCGHNPGCPCGGCVAMRGDQPVREPPPESIAVVPPRVRCTCGAWTLAVGQVTDKGENGVIHSISTPCSRREPPPERCAECHGEHFDMAGNRMPCPACGGRGSK